MNTSSLIIEIFIEELPFSGVKKEIANVLPKFNKILQANKINAKIDFFWTPRRLILHSLDFPLFLNDEIVEFFGPPLSIAYNDGEPSIATNSFLKKLNITKDEVQIKQKNGKDFLYYSSTLKGKQTSILLQDIVMEFLASLNFGKSMKWGINDTLFIRPIRNIFILLNDNFIEIPSLASKYHFTQTNYIIPHRSKDKKAISNYKEYFDFLIQNGVIYSQMERKKLIVEQIKDIETKLNIKVEIDNNLLDEVVAITEFPTALYGEFESRFLTLPKEVIITSMKINQKYFATYKNNSLNNGFIVVCNILDTNSFSDVVKGNERVLKARFEDALFFYQNDLNTFNQINTDLRLKNIEFIQDSGSIFDKVQREKEIAKILISQIDCNSDVVLKALDISKNDLLSEMVGEFGELQGIMGSYYTNNDKLRIPLKEQYLPLQEDTELPTMPESGIIAIANKLDSIISIFAINKIPSGSKDPFALRRACSGIIKIIIKFNIPFNLKDILHLLKPQYKQIDTIAIINFFYERLENTLEMNQSIINAALKSNQDDLLQICLQIEALNKIIKSDDKDAFKSLFKRVANILKNTNINAESINKDLLLQIEEKNLYKALQDFRNLDLKTPMERVENLLRFKGLLQDFFDNVMINAEEKNIRENRILLVKGIYEEFFKVGDIREISF
ncbi:glycine--tRNA ligase subunit beta [Helicobacter sp. 16-1353]|uniref:glycine--tRNA ligase subunit beta n=1 Tax=Helicobacter sp. 16-1353 TaxID=2004996 RepID=UPI000DCDA009|nr:glycine--tRNA ligase subunit beta [Helicobacter sp. 16-1353]RAX54612.1 glycine--tRNA ligase subunit beta [Helicobacter sp. 16-1353]